MGTGQRKGKILGCKLKVKFRFLSSFLQLSFRRLPIRLSSSSYPSSIEHIYIHVYENNNEKERFYIQFY